MKKCIRLIIIIISFILTLLGVYSSIGYGYRSWFTLFIIPMYIFIANVNAVIKNKTTLNAGIKNFIKIYVLYFLMAAFFEFSGNSLGVWYAPEIFGVSYLFHGLMIGYPLPLLTLAEVFNFAYYFVRKFSNSIYFKTVFSMIISMLVVSITSESLNNFAYGWVYQNLPFTGILIFGTDLLIIFGWIVLAFLSIFILGLLKIKNSIWISIELKEF